MLYERILRELYQWLNDSRARALRLEELPRCNSRHDDLIAERREYSVILAVITMIMHEEERARKERFQELKKEEEDLHAAYYRALEDVRKL